MEEMRRREGESPHDDAILHTSVCVVGSRRRLCLSACKLKL